VGATKKRLSCHHRGFTFSAKETEIGGKKKVEKKGEPVTIGMTRATPASIIFHDDPTANGGAPFS